MRLGDPELRPVLFAEVTQSGGKHVPRVTAVQAHASAAEVQESGAKFMPIYSDRGTSVQSIRIGYGLPPGLVSAEPFRSGPPGMVATLATGSLRVTGRLVARRLIGR